MKEEEGGSLSPFRSVEHGRRRWRERFSVGEGERFTTFGKEERGDEGRERKVHHEN